MNLFKDKNILVTGGEGFVGFNLVRRLGDINASIRATYYQEKPHYHHPRTEYVQCDLLNSEAVQKICQDIDFVFHCAAFTSGAAGMQLNPLDFIKPNIVMHINILESANINNVKKIMVLSSSTGYPDMGNQPLKEDSFFMDDPFEKYLIVGWVNRYTEILCRNFSQFSTNSLKTVVLRPTNIYGEYDNFDLKTSHVFPALIRKVVERHNPIEIWGTGDDIRDLLYIEDFIDAAFLAMDKIESYNPLNIGSGKGYSVKEMIRMITDIDGYTDAEIVFNTSKPSMIPVRLVDIEKAKHLLDFKAKTSLKEGIQKTLKWYREVQLAWK